MADNQDLDRNDAATPYKLSEARKRGQVAKSADVVSVVVMATAVVYFSAHAFDLLRMQFRFDHALLSMTTTHSHSTVALWQLVATSVRHAMHLLFPLLGAIAVAAIVANLAQVGFIFSMHPLKPDWQRVNPTTGFKRVFSMRTLFDAGRTCVKFMFLTLVAVAALKALLPNLHQVPGEAPLAFMAMLAESSSSLGLKLVLALALVALIDLAYSRREFAKKMQMSRRELRDEVKHREGDPRIRARLRELRLELLKRSKSLGNTRNADLLITNPTHVAIALKYRHGEMEAPQLLAKGTGATAALMRNVAARHRIPVIQSPRLARALYAELAIDQTVPQRFYVDLAPLVVWLMAMHAPHHARNSGQAPA